MNKEHKNILLQQRAYIMENLTCDEFFLAHLLSFGTLTLHHKEKIKNKATSCEMIGVLLDHLQRCGPDAFDHFISALYETRQEFIANALLKDIPGTSRNEDCDSSLDDLVSEFDQVDITENRSAPADLNASASPFSSSRQPKIHFEKIAYCPVDDATFLPEGTILYISGAKLHFHGIDLEPPGEISNPCFLESCTSSKKTNFVYKDHGSNELIQYVYKNKRWSRQLNLHQHNQILRFVSGKRSLYFTTKSGDNYELFTYPELKLIKSFMTHIGGLALDDNDNIHVLVNSKVYVFDEDGDDQLDCIPLNIHVPPSGFWKHYDGNYMLAFDMETEGSDPDMCHYQFQKYSNTGELISNIGEAEMNKVKSMSFDKEYGLLMGTYDGLFVSGPIG